MEYWLKHNYNKILNRDIAIEMLEQAVNLPYIELERNKYRHKANLHLQRSYNLVVALDKRIAVDGLIGPQTLRAVNNCNKPIGLYNALNVIQGNHYIYLAEHDEKYKSFVVGWLNNRIDIKKH
jgi:lysozyme family protein